eukprot:TRINITY_DN544_c1_g1_i2.p1 TRINITY_DN544_c1_g1~~TRINITY_DN544_c1_g1_i2.p1  ORF type:complete len:341 (-),score=100.87 TRINITY_DN544_c1_g1_i2:115-1137(-)
MALEHRPLGKQGLVVPCQGLGTMGMTAFYASDQSPEEKEAESLRTIAKYLELSGGKAFLDTAWIYKSETEHNETLVGKAIKIHGRDKFIIATKFGVDLANTDRRQDARPEAIRRQLSESLARLGTDYVDLYYQHRQDPQTPIESVAETLKQLVAEGKVRYIGFSEVTGNEIRRAHAVHPVSAIQMEWSLQSRDLEAEVVPAARELGVGIVAYSPLGRGLLATAFTKRDDLKPGDFRLHAPRFSEENMQVNAAAAQRLAELAAKKGATAAQLALAWVHSRGRDVFPIPGTKTVKRLEENLAAASIQLSAAELAEIEAAVPQGAGQRYPDMAATFNSRSNPL